MECSLDSQWGRGYIPEGKEAVELEKFGREEEGLFHSSDSQSISVIMQIVVFVWQDLYLYVINNK